MSDLPPPDFPHPSNNDLGEIIQHVDYRNGIPYIHIIGEAKSKQQLQTVYVSLLEQHGILARPEEFLIRNVRKSMIQEVLDHGCERNEGSYRDRVLESDFSIGPNDYTYCHGFDGNRQEYLRHAIYDPKGTVLVIYRSNKMIPHFEEKYDKASSLGLGSTRVTYEFKDKDHKRDAVFLVAQAEFNELDDLIWQ